MATTTGGNKHKRLKLGVEIEILKAKPLRSTNKIIKGHVLATQAEPTPQTETTSAKTNTNQKREDGWVLPRELLDDGQGKSALDMEISESSDSKRDTANTGGNETAPEHAIPRADNWNKHVLLRPLIIKATGKIATGATTSKLRKQNKLHRMNCLLQQPLVLQWERHNGATIIPGDHWDQQQKTSDAWEMAPQGLALNHEAAGLLADWEQFGCPTRTGRDWTLNKIQAAINRGPHKSALEPNAIAHFAEEVADKVAKGQAQVFLWDDVKTDHPRHLKVSPVAAIPHKSRAYRSILDLSFSL